MKKANCRKSEDEKRIHDRAVNLRKMTDIQLVEAVQKSEEDRAMIAALERENQALKEMVETARKGEAANANVNVMTQEKLDKKKEEVRELDSRLQDAKTEICELRKRLAAATKALNEAEEKAGTAFLPDLAGGLKAWLSGYGIKARGVGPSVLSGLLTVVDMTPEEGLRNLFQ